MFTSLALSLLAAALPLARAQTYTTCNPLKGTCPSDPAIGGALDSNFVGASALPAGWSAVAGAVSFGANGANFVVKEQGDHPTIQSDNYFFFGYVEVKMQAAAGQGIVSSIVMQSDDLDEVDWEFTGTDTTQTQTNYFGKGDTTTYDRAIWFPVASPQTSMHTYAVNWTSSALVWLIDGVAVRTLNYGDAQGGARFPQTPMKLKVGIWAGGDPSNGQGTIEWSGGPTTFGPSYTMSVASINIVNYSPASSYAFGDTSGSWGSIKVSGGNAGSNIQAEAASGTAAIKVSTASSHIPTATAGGVTSSAMLTQIPLATPSANSTSGLKTTTTGSGSSSSASQTSSGAAASKSSSASTSLNVGSTLGVGAIVAALSWLL